MAQFGPGQGVLYAYDNDILEGIDTYRHIEATIR